MPVVGFRKTLNCIANCSLKSTSWVMIVLLLGTFPEAPLQGMFGYRDTFMSLCMPPAAPTGLAQSMDRLLGLSLSPSLPILTPSAALCSWPLCQYLGHWKEMSSRKGCIHWWSHPAYTRWINDSTHDDPEEYFLAIATRWLIHYTVKPEEHISRPVSSTSRGLEFMSQESPSFYKNWALVHS